MLRINRFRLHASDVAAFVDHTTDTVFPRVAAAGMVTALVGIRGTGDVLDLAVASRFHRVETMMGAVGADLDRPVFLGEEWAGRLIDPHAEHYEAMDLEQPADPPGECRVLRIFRGTIVEERAVEYYDHIRAEAWPRILRMPGLVAGYSGRRLAVGCHAFAFVTAWRSIEDLPDADETTGPPLSSFQGIADQEVEHFRLLARL